jgi:hypothetical protein
MRTLLLFTTLFSLISSAGAQQFKTSAQGNISFGVPLPPGFWIYKDTVSNPANIWNEGMPHKAVFDNPFSGIAMITDTGSNYPVNDTSSFIIGQTAMGSWEYPGGQTALTGHYWVNSDSLTDYGKIEVSVDKGLNWIDILIDTSYDFFSAGGKPVLTGNSNGWKSFQMNLNDFADSMHLTIGDTILFKFSFISDGIETNKDGLMFDELFFYDWWESSVSPVAIVPSRINPNPSTDFVTVQSLTQFYYSKAKLSVLDLAGREVLRKTFTENERLLVPVKGLQNGVYFYRITTDKGNVLAGKFLKE